MSKTSLLLLGTGTPNCEADKAQTSSAVIVDNFPYIVDCGGGTVQRMAEAQGKGHTALESPNLTRIFLTHLHPDHVVGLADFIIAPWVRRRTEPVHIYGPKGTEEMVANLLKAFQIGIGEHDHGLAPITAPIGAIAHEYDAGIIYEDERVNVEAFRVAHGGLDAFGLKFISEDKTIVFSGDTGPVDILKEKAKGCDILVHEVYCKKALDQRDAGWQGYHTVAHTSGIDVGKIANEAQPDLVVLHHVLLWGLATENELLAEISSEYDGAVWLGKDLDYIT